MRRVRSALVTVAIVLAIALLASACRREDNSVPEVESQDRIIRTAFTTDDPSVLALTWFAAPCETFTDVEVRLDDTFVNLEIHVEVDVASCDESGVAGAIGAVTVDLGEPLGDREIFDLAFNNTVELNAEPAN